MVSEPRTRRTRIRDPKTGKVTVTVEWTVHDDGRVVVHLDDQRREHSIRASVQADGTVTSFALDARPGSAVTTATLRSAGSPDLMRRLAAAGRSGVLADRMFGVRDLAADARVDLVAAVRSVEQQRIAQERAKRERKPGTSTRRRGPALDELVATVAATYRQRIALDDPTPRRTTAGALGYSEAYVGRLLGKARARGLLAPAPGPGRPGEARPLKTARKPSRPTERNGDGSTK